MGMTSRWFRALFVAKKSSGSPSKEKKKKKKNWTVGRSSAGNDSGIREDSLAVPYPEAMDANKHAIAVAAATAAVAEAALAAAQAAAEVVRLTSGGAGGSRLPAIVHVRGIDRRREWAAVKIQSAFRAYLARRALGALKGLVKLQALVRGHIVRKQSADMLQRMQAMARIQAKACANRAHLSQYSHSSSKASHSHQPRSQPKPNIKDVVDLERTNLSSKWLDRWMQECTWNRHRDISPLTGRTDEEKSDKILEVDTWRPQLNSRHGDGISQTPQDITAGNYGNQFVAHDSLPRHSANSQNPNPSLSSTEAMSIGSLKVPMEGDQAAARAVESPELYSASSRPGSSSRRGPFTPVRSECSRSVFSEYLSHPNYMAYTESSRAKVRSQSAPRQRIHFERPGPTKRYVHGYWDADTISERGSTLQANFRSRAYPGSGQMDNRIRLSFQGGSATTARNSSSYGGRS